MTDTSPRALAAAVLLAVLRDRSYLNTALRQLVPATLAERDAALVRALCYGTLRFQPRLEFWLSQLLGRPLKEHDLDIHALLLLGMYSWRKCACRPMPR